VAVDNKTTKCFSFYILLILHHFLLRCRHVDRYGLLLPGVRRAEGRRERPQLLQKKVGTHSHLQPSDGRRSRRSSISLRFPLTLLPPILSPPE